MPTQAQASVAARAPALSLLLPTTSKSIVRRQSQQELQRPVSRSPGRGRLSNQIAGASLRGLSMDAFDEATSNRDGCITKGEFVNAFASKVSPMSSRQMSPVRQ